MKEFKERDLEKMVHLADHADFAFAMMAKDGLGSSSMGISLVAWLQALKVAVASKTITFEQSRQINKVAATLSAAVSKYRAGPGPIPVATVNEVLRLLGVQFDEDQPQQPATPPAEQEFPVWKGDEQAPEINHV